MLSRVTLRTKLILVGTIAAALPALGAWAIVVLIQPAAPKPVAVPAELAETSLDQAIDTWRNVCSVRQEGLERQIDTKLSVFRRIIRDTQPLTVSDDVVTWTVVDPSTGSSADVELPIIHLGSTPILPLVEATTSQPSSALTAVNDLVPGGICSVLQRSNIEGDMIVIRTTATDTQGRLAAPALITAKDGTRINPVIRSLLAGRTYRGLLIQGGKTCLAAFEPILNTHRRMIAAIGVAVPLTDSVAIKTAFDHAQFGRTGTVRLAQFNDPQVRTAVGDLPSDQWPDAFDLKTTANGRPVTVRMKHFPAWDCMIVAQVDTTEITPPTPAAVVVPTWTLEHAMMILVGASTLIGALLWLAMAHHVYNKVRILLAHHRQTILASIEPKKEEPQPEPAEDDRPRLVETQASRLTSRTPARYTPTTSTSPAPAPASERPKSTEVQPLRPFSSTLKNVAPDKTPTVTAAPSAATENSPEAVKSRFAALQSVARANLAAVARNGSTEKTPATPATNTRPTPQAKPTNTNTAPAKPTASTPAPTPNSPRVTPSITARRIPRP